MALNLDKGLYNIDVPVLKQLDEYHLENMFKVYFDKNGRAFYNLGKTINFDFNNIDEKFYSLYEYTGNIPLTLLSQKMYSTQHLWWLILMFNNIQNPILMVPKGTILKIPTVEAVRIVLDQMSINLANSK